jgi:hypothetical protein
LIPGRRDQRGQFNLSVKRDKRCDFLRSSEVSRTRKRRADPLAGGRSDASIHRTPPAANQLSNIA